MRANRVVSGITRNDIELLELIRVSWMVSFTQNVAKNIACSLVICLPTFLICATRIAAQVAVRSETVHTMAGQPIRDGVVLIRDGKIERVGPSAEVKIPSGYKTLCAKVVTPA